MKQSSSITSFHIERGFVHIERGLGHIERGFVLPSVHTIANSINKHISRLNDKTNTLGTFTKQYACTSGSVTRDVSGLNVIHPSYVGIS